MDPWNILIWLGSAGFVLCLVPQLLRTIQLRRADDISVAFLLLVLVSSGVTLPYMIHVKEFVFASAQVFNILVWGTVLYFRLNPAPKAIAPA